MPDRPHHTDKWHSCVEKVMAQGRDEAGAAAVCTASLQKAGEPIFEGMASRSAAEFIALQQFEPRKMVPRPKKNLYSLHLLNATGLSRTEMLGTIEHLVVPVVALMEGVIHAVNSAHPEFVPLATLQKAAATWNGRPIVIGHPMKDGKQCSANAPEIQHKHAIGTVYNARVEGKKLLCEAWIDKAKAKKLDPELFERLVANQHEEVSVGAFVVTDNVAGKWHDQPYKGSWLETIGDHLAFLPGGRGACSVEMGCGTHRAAAYLVTAEGFVARKTTTRNFKTLKARLLQLFDTPEEAASEEAAELIAYNSMRTLLDACGDQWDEASGLIDDLIADETENPTETAAQEEAEEEVEEARLESIRMLCYSMVTALQSIVSVTYALTAEDLPAETSPRYMEELRIAIGKSISAQTLKTVQAMHDQTVSLGAKCDRSNYKLLKGSKVDCSCKGVGHGQTNAS